MIEPTCNEYRPPTSDEVYDMVQLGLAAITEEEKRQILTAYMSGQCIVFFENYRLADLLHFAGEMELLRNFYGTNPTYTSDDAARITSAISMVNSILKGLGRMEYAHKHNLLTRIDAYDE